MRFSVIFLSQITSLTMSNICQSKTTKYIFGGPNLGQTCQNQAQVQVFCLFLKVGSLVFLQVAQDDRLKQLLVEVKLTKKNGWPENRFFAIFSSLHYWFSLILHSCTGLQLGTELKPQKKKKKKKMQPKLGPNRPKLGSK